MNGKIVKQAKTTELGASAPTPQQKSLGLTDKLIKRPSNYKPGQQTNYSDKVVKEVASFVPPVRPQSGVLAALGYGSGGTIPGAPGPTPPPIPPPIQPHQILINGSDYLLINASEDHFII